MAEEETGDYENRKAIGDIPETDKNQEIKAMLARNSVEALIDDTYNDLLVATKNTERIKTLVRNVVSDTIRVRAVEQLGRKTMRKEIAGRLAAQGLSRTLESDQLLEGHFSSTG